MVNVKENLKAEYKQSKALVNLCVIKNVLTWAWDKQTASPQSCPCLTAQKPHLTLALLLSRTWPPWRARTKYVPLRSEFLQLERSSVPPELSPS